MPDIAALLLQGSDNLWLFVPSAILLGALHGLEPGHSKTMMAAFIVAIRGSVAQAIMLGLAATVSHTAVVWAVALVGLHYGSQIQSEHTEDWFQLVSGLIIVAVGLWMLWRVQRQIHHAGAGHHHDHDDDAHDDHDHEDNEHEDHHPHDQQPPATSATSLNFSDGANEYQDDHERAHAEDIRRRFTNRPVTNGQILLFGLTGGLIPCPASITVLLVCLQLKKLALGATLVLCFSIGLALTLVLAGVAAALSMRHASQRWSGFGEFARRAPYFSGVIILLVGVYMCYHGGSGLI